ncbi:paeninodin family lasso peptide [Bacillus sp. T3]|uniref:paeninodin family lasso peptide n=1 Tax=Bacillus sp. T3 TaxID=467262 RepID=UPI003994533C
MKKEWKKPTLEMLNVSMTMSGMGGTAVDGEVKEMLKDGTVGDETFPTHGPIS